MKNGFNFEMYETIFKNCFIHSSRYQNGNLQLSLFGIDPETNETTHFADITLNQSDILLKEYEIIVDCKNRPTLIKQLINLGILKEQIARCVVKNVIYPIYTIDFTKIQENCYYVQELIAA